MTTRYLFIGLCLLAFTIFGCNGNDSEDITTLEVSSDYLTGGEGITSDSISDSGSGSNSEDGNGIQSGMLTAGDIDDNLNFDAFQNHIDSVLQSDVDQVFPSINITDRITIRITDVNGEGVSNARLRILDNASVILFESYSNTDGVFYLFPTLDIGINTQDLIVNVRPPNSETPSTEVALNLGDLNDDRLIEIVMDQYTSSLPDALELMFVIDTTGSMADELKYLTTEFESIIEAIQLEYSQISMRFGLILYRDTGDQYIVRNFDFTDSINEMQTQLAAQSADGGGDYPEAMDQAISKALNAQWKGGNTARLLFLVADAPPHDDKLSDTFISSQSARKMGIHIYPLAASGAADIAENLMRIMAVTTQGRHLFLTDDSGVGNTHSVPKIPCYIVTRLDHLIIRVVSSALEGQRIEPEADHILREAGNYDLGVCSDNGN